MANPNLRLGGSESQRVVGASKWLKKPMIVYKRPLRIVQDLQLSTHPLHFIKCYKMLILRWKERKMPWHTFFFQINGSKVFLLLYNEFDHIMLAFSLQVHDQPAKEEGEREWRERYNFIYYPLKIFKHFRQATAILFIHCVIQIHVLLTI